MKLTIDFSPSNTGEVQFVGCLGVALQAITENMVNKSKEESKQKPEPETDAPTEETPASEAPVTEAPIAEEKPKRTRRSKKTEEPVAEETPTQEETPAQESAPVDNGELPFDNEVNEAPVAETKNEAPAEFPTMTKDEFTEINKAKRAELGLTGDGEHADLIRDFNTFCQKWASVTYGTTKPSTLPGDKLWQFAQWFKDIQLNPDYIPGSADDEHGCPFVSNALSK